MNFNYERRLWKKGFARVAGVDEAGRGPLAGPVVAAAVIFPPDIKIKGLNDSKKLSPKKREKLFREITKKAIAFAVSSISHSLIDRINIGRAGLLAMKRAVEKLSLAPDFLLVDGKNFRLDLPVQQRSITHGDARCASVAAASILAKVTRDSLMLKYHKQYPLYRFDLHKGYGTQEHFRRLRENGPCAIHRRSFYPVSSLVFK
jgi:ribonuclease HII